jgi:hypothetical protein
LLTISLNQTESVVMFFRDKTDEVRDADIKIVKNQ